MKLYQADIHKHRLLIPLYFYKTAYTKILPFIGQVFGGNIGDQQVKYLFSDTDSMMIISIIAHLKDIYKCLKKDK